MLELKAPFDSGSSHFSFNRCHRVRSIRGQPAHSDKTRSDIDMGDRYGRSIWEIDGIYHIDMVNMNIDVGYGLMIWEMGVSIWSCSISIWKDLAL
jgi:hypothetical protein